MSLKSRTFTAIRWTAFGAFFSSLLKLAQVSVLARLLHPEDFGLMALVLMVLGLTTVFSDLGLGSAYMQRRDVSLEQRSSLYWANIGTSLCLVAVVVLASNTIAGFFGEPRLGALLMLSSSTFVISALGQQLRITAQKELEFGRVVSLELFSAGVGFLVAVGLAILGYGVYSLVWSAIAAAASLTVLSWFFLARGWRPRWRFRVHDVTGFMGFGSSVVGNGLISQLNMTVDLLLGGRMLSAAQLGMYSVPRNLVLQTQFLVNPIVTRVGFPLIAEVQNNIANVRRIYLKTLNMTASTNAPIYVGLAFFSHEIVEVLFGSRWSSAAPLLTVLAIWGMVRSTANPAGSLLLGMGRANLAFKWNLILLFVGPPLLWFGSRYGIEGLAWSLLSFQVAVFVPLWAILIRPLCRAGFLEYVAACIKPQVIALLAVAPSYLLLGAVESTIPKLFFAVTISAILYMGLSYLFNRDWCVSMVELFGKKIT